MCSSESRKSNFSTIIIVIIIIKSRFEQVLVKHWQSAATINSQGHKTNIKYGICAEYLQTSLNIWKPNQSSSRWSRTQRDCCRRRSSRVQVCPGVSRCVQPWDTVTTSSHTVRTGGAEWRPLCQTTCKDKDILLNIPVDIWVYVTFVSVQVDFHQQNQVKIKMRLQQVFMSRRSSVEMLGRTFSKPPIRTETGLKWLANEWKFPPVSVKASCSLSGTEPYALYLEDGVSELRRPPAVSLSSFNEAGGSSSGCSWRDDGETSGCEEFL